MFGFGRKEKYRIVSMQEGLDLLKEHPEAVILDVRTPEEYAQGHIPHALNIPNETIGSGTLVQLPDRKAMILVYCRSGRRAMDACSKLSSAGYTNLVEFGGILDYHGEMEKGDNA